MQRIILFRFDRDVDVCSNRLEQIASLNPGVPIYGIYGGKEEELEIFSNALTKYFTHLYCIRGKDSEWKWQNFDLALRDWYKEVGNGVDFDMAHVIEWDLIFLNPIEQLYAHIDKQEVGITGLVPLSEVAHRWDWVTKEPEKSEWEQLLRFVGEKFSYNQIPYASLAPGFCFPKAFLKGYAEIEVPELVHDELRIPLYAQILGFDCVDTKFYKKWFDREESEYFNCFNKEIDESLILKEKNIPNGRRVFHPFRKNFIL